MREGLVPCVRGDAARVGVRRVLNVALEDNGDDGTDGHPWSTSVDERPN